MAETTSSRGAETAEQKAKVKRLWEWSKRKANSGFRGMMGLNSEDYSDDIPTEGVQVVHLMQPRRDLPEGSVKKYWIPYLTHILVGFAAGLGMLVGPALESAVVAVPFVMLVVFICVRQTVEFMRRRDTPGRDLQHYMMGYMGGLIVGAALLGTVL